MLNKTFFKKTAVSIVLFFIIAALFIFALYDYPVPGGDSVYFVPAAINHKLGYGLINQLAPLFLTADPTGAGKFVIFPPLYPLVLSWLMPGGASHDAFMAMFFLYAATMLAAGFLFIKLIIRDWQKAHWYTIAIVLSSLLALAAVTIFYPGRPETLSRLLLTLALLALVYPAKTWLWLFLGIITGLSAATHPGPAILAAPLLGIFFAMYYPTKKAVVLIFLCFAVSCLTFFLITELFGHGALTTIVGMIHHFSFLHTTMTPAQYVASGENIKFQLHIGDPFREIIKNLAIPRESALQGPLILFSLICAVLLFRRLNSKTCARNLFYVCSAALFGSIFFLMTTRFEIHYVLALTPLGLFTIAHYATAATDSKILKSISIAVIIFGSLIFFHRLALFPFFVKSGMSLENARGNFQRLRLTESQRVGVDSTLWPISEEYGRMYLYGNDEDVKHPMGVIITRENFSGWTRLPPELGYCRKIKDLFTHKEPRILDILLSPAIPSYAFAVYDCAPHHSD